MNEKKLLLGLIGAGIGRSLTPRMHEEEARHHGLRLHYQLIDLDATGATLDRLPQLIAAARTMGFAGLNITYPCKQAVIPLLDELSPEAAAVGAVNTVVFRAGKAIGYNTDGSGWAWAFRKRLPDAAMNKVVQVGAGGAGAAIADALLRLGTRELVIVDREAERARQLAERLNKLHDSGVARTAAEVADAVDGADGIAHCTPVGMDKLPGLPFPAELLHPSMWVAEVVYFPLDTALLEAARARGCATVDGGGMAVGQAVDAFRLFTGREPDAPRMEAYFRGLIAQRGDASRAT